MAREYPESPAGSFKGPPRRFQDAEGRKITVDEFGAYHGHDDEYEKLVTMYVAFNPEDRAQGLPPKGEERVRSWLDILLRDDCLNVVAWHEESAVGHATLVPDEDDYELAIFVLRKYQNSGIGTNLLETLLGLAQERGVERVYLTVERWNTPARKLYRKMGFEQTSRESFEIEMTLRLV
ncbi:GNAT family N-acetyltransferase [halophilic archaeon]|nr:GNAT family N-acetyltransferase [halophilic archaeon]